MLHATLEYKKKISFEYLWPLLTFFESVGPRIISFKFTDILGTILWSHTVYKRIYIETYRAAMLYRESEFISSTTVGIPSNHDYSNYHERLTQDNDGFIGWVCVDLKILDGSLKYDSNICRWELFIFLLVIFLGVSCFVKTHNKTDGTDLKTSGTGNCFSLLFHWQSLFWRRSSDYWFRISKARIDSAFEKDLMDQC